MKGPLIIIVLGVGGFNGESHVSRQLAALGPESTTHLVVRRLESGQLQ